MVLPGHSTHNPHLAALIDETGEWWVGRSTDQSFFK
jgi:hypothetical protein